MAMGYQGLAQIGSQALPTAGIDAGFTNLLINSASVNLQLNPIYSTSIWGAGWYNGAMTVNYADNVVTYEGGIEFELQASRNNWNLIRDWVIESRAYSRAARITPDGSWIYNYTGSSGGNDTGGPAQDPRDPATYTNDETSRQGLWARGLGLSTAEGQVVTASLDVVGLERFVHGPDDPTTFGGNLIDPSLSGIADPGSVSYVQDKFGLSNPNNPLNPGGNNYDPIPYWRTEAFIRRQDENTLAWDRVAIGPVGNQVDTETVSWDVNIANNTVILYTCRGVRGASAVLQGPIDASGSVTLYNPFGVFDPIFGAPGVGTWVSGPSPYDEENPAFYAANTQFFVGITGANVAFVVPAVVLESDDYGIRAQGEVTNRQFNIKGLGGRLLSELDIPAGFNAYSPNDMSPGHPVPTDVSLPPAIMTLAT